MQKSLILYKTAKNLEAVKTAEKHVPIILNWQRHVTDKEPEKNAPHVWVAEVKYFHLNYGKEKSSVINGWRFNLLSK